MLAAITLKDSARSPSWSRLWTRMRFAEVALTQPLRADDRRVDVAGDGPGEHETEAEGDEIHHQEHAGDHGQQLDQDIAQVEGAGREAAQDVVGLSVHRHGDDVGLCRPSTGAPPVSHRR